MDLDNDLQICAHFDGLRKMQQILITKVYKLGGNFDVTLAAVKKRRFRSRLNNICGAIQDFCYTDRTINLIS